MFFLCQLVIFLEITAVHSEKKIKPFLSFEHPITRFWLLFLGLLMVFSILLYPKSFKPYFYNPVTAFIASQSAWILKALGMKVKSGVFRAMMDIELVNDGPVTILIENCPGFAEDPALREKLKIVEMDGEVGGDEENCQKEKGFLELST